MGIGDWGIILNKNNNDENISDKDIKLNKNEQNYTPTTLSIKSDSEEVNYEEDMNKFLINIILFY